MKEGLKRWLTHTHNKKKMNLFLRSNKTKGEYVGSSTSYVSETHFKKKISALTKTFLIIFRRENKNPDWCLGTVEQRFRKPK